MSAPMELDDPAADLKTALLSKLTSGEFSDLTITCGEKTFKVHKVIICSQSPVLHNACKKGTFKESETGVVNLPDDDPPLVEAMIDFMYTFRYRDFDKGDQGALLFHIKLFALADKYDICRLRNMTVSRFKEIAGCRLYSELIVAIEAVYTTTPSSVRGLREAAIETADYHLKSLLENQSFQDFMDKNGEFGKDLTKKIHSETYARPESLGLIHFQCSDCELSFLMNVYDVEQYDLDNAKSPLVHKNGWLKCVCPRCGCHARSDSYFCGMAESGFHFLKYSCKGTSDNCGKVIFCSHEDEKLDEKRGLHINCPICPWWMTLEGKA